MTLWLWTAWFGVLFLLFLAAAVTVARWAPNRLPSGIAVFVLMSLASIFLAAVIITAILAGVR